MERSSIDSSDGSGSGSGFIDSLHSERKTRKASRWITESAADDALAPPNSSRWKTTLSIWVSVAFAVVWITATFETR